MSNCPSSPCGHVNMSSFSVYHQFYCSTRLIIDYDMFNVNRFIWNGNITKCNLVVDVVILEEMYQWLSALRFLMLKQTQWLYLLTIDWGIELSYSQALCLPACACDSSHDDWQPYPLENVKVMKPIQLLVPAKWQTLWSLSSCFSLLGFGLQDFPLYMFVWENFESF